MSTWIYIVTWCLFTIVPASWESTTDDYGIQIMIHSKADTLTDCNHRKIFFYRDSALLFIKNAPFQVKNIRIDSTQDWNTLNSNVTIKPLGTFILN